MGALTVMIIRHGEKPDKAGNPGFRGDGSLDDAALSPRGWQRAGAWSALLGTGLGGADYPRPDAIFAADPARAVTGRVSLRQAQTVTPLAARLGLDPVTRFAKGEEQALAAAIGTMSGAVLVCWEYRLITAALLPALLTDATSDDVPQGWDVARFDVLLRLDRAAPGAPWSMRQLFPRLLAGDSDVPLR